MSAMWCRDCKQDVPGCAAPDRTYRCSRCGGPLVACDETPEIAGAGLLADGAGVVDSSSSGLGDGDSAPREGAATDGFEGFDDWEFDEQLREIGRLLRAAAPTAGAQGDDNRVAETPRLRCDRPHPAAGTPHTLLPGVHDDSKLSGSGLGSLAWAALSLGTMGLVCGGILLGWSIWADRADLWSVGLPIALGGQIGLVVGLLCQLDRVWHDHRQAARKLDEVDRKLHDLRATTAQLSTTHSSPATAFYCHLASGAPPEMLLGDLKSQLDLLAAQLSRQS